MKQIGIYFLIASILILAIVISYFYISDSRAEARAAVLSKKSTFGEVDLIDPNRKVRQVIRPKEMQQAVAVISDVFRTALKTSIETKTDVEIRFYPPKQSPNITDFYRPNGWVYEALQPFQINADKTRTPLGMPCHLPNGVVCYTDGMSGMVFIDHYRNLMWFTIYPDFCANIILYDLNLSTQAPIRDRTVTIVDGATYDDAGDDILYKVGMHTNVPDWDYLPSFPVRPK